VLVLDAGCGSAPKGAGVLLVADAGVATTQPELRILYRVDGSPQARERELPWLEGYRGSGPVRIGNGAAQQLQLDVYGGVLESIWLYVQQVGHIDRDTGKQVARIADWVATHWRPDRASGRSGAAGALHPVESFCRVALDRACRLGERGAILDRSAGARPRTSARVHRDPGLGRGAGELRTGGLREPDASLPTMPLLDYGDPKGERMRSTIDTVERELRKGPFVYRYRGDDGVGGPEGAFLTCSFWLVEALAHAGRLDRAHALMDELVGLANDVGLYSEEVDEHTHDFLGNFPQALTHLALVNAAVGIADEEAAGRRAA
jgi:GH15 family glucan-1,4-alpha-glucosidase